jgi:transcriptional regulator CtsR
MYTIEPVKIDLSNWRLNRLIFVHDAGMSSQENLRYLQRGGGHYIVGRKLKSSETEARVLDQVQQARKAIAQEVQDVTVVVMEKVLHRRLSS